MPARPQRGPNLRDGFHINLLTQPLVGFRSNLVDCTLRREWRNMQGVGAQGGRNSVSQTGRLGQFRPSNRGYPLTNCERGHLAQPCRDRPEWDEPLNV